MFINQFFPITLFCCSHLTHCSAFACVHAHSILQNGRCSNYESQVKTDKSVTKLGSVLSFARPTPLWGFRAQTTPERGWVFTQEGKSRGEVPAPAPCRLGKETVTTRRTAGYTANRVIHAGGTRPKFSGEAACMLSFEREVAFESDKEGAQVRCG